MKFYITEETKQEIKDKIAEVKKVQLLDSNPFASSSYWSEISLYEKILSSATILPVEESWIAITPSTLAFHYNQKFPNGLIIQPK
jgi:hypothetical protein